MNAFRLSLLAACVLVLGFDLARDGSEQMRLRHDIEKKQKQLSRIRQDLSVTRGKYEARLVSITWSDSGVVIEELLQPEIASAFDVDRDTSGLPISLNDHLEAGRGD
ncbi:MAG: hypothetical protein HRU16_02160 [Planctomycetes bacterium]|nr:hypothetical protein [Planctomycetota bacterium]